MEDIERWVKRRLEEGYSTKEIKESLENNDYDLQILDEITGKEVKERGKNKWIVSGLALLIIAIGVFVASETIFSSCIEETTVKRNVDSPRRPGSSPEVEIEIESECEDITVKESVPSGLEVVDTEKDNYQTEENEIVWEIESKRNTVSYEVLTPGASTGDYSFEGIFSYQNQTRQIKGDNELLVRW